MGHKSMSVWDNLFFLKDNRFVHIVSVKWTVLIVHLRCVLCRHFVPANTSMNALRISIVIYNVVLVQHCWRILEEWARLAAELLVNLPLIWCWKNPFLILYSGWKWIRTLHFNQSSCVRSQRAVCTRWQVKYWIFCRRANILFMILFLFFEFGIFFRANC